jgi:farnesyl-diphosphate farnesyltransferase
MIAIITALKEELSPLLRRAKVDRIDRGAYVGTLDGIPVVMKSTGAGVANAEKNLNDLLHRFTTIDSIIAAGVAGAIAPHLKRGDIVTDRIATVDKITRDKNTIDADAIDMESAGWKRAAERAGVPIRIVRVIFDSVDEPVPDFVGDTVDRGAIARYAITHPWVIPTLIRMRSRMTAVCEKLAATVEAEVAPLRSLLEETSRTFALCIPLLNEGVREQVEIAYLLFRIADTFEDASHWAVEDRLAALDEFCDVLRKPEGAKRFAEKWYAKKPASHAGYLRLIADVPVVVDAFTKMPNEAIDIVREHVIRSAKGMASFVAMTHDGALQLTDMKQLRAYCYAVAGIVGEMLTELFLLNSTQLRSAGSFLRARAAAFGEGLQLVNILKDWRSDLSEGRTYIPPNADRNEVIGLARADLDSATEYTLAVQNAGGPKGIVAFIALPVALARATLDRLQTSSATKITRPQVFRITRRVRRAVERGRPPLEVRPSDAAPNEVTLVHP